MGDLLQKVLEWTNLCLAWEAVMDNRGMPGTDQISIQRWNWHWEDNLLQLAAAVRANTYRPAPLRVRRIPKSQPGQWRELLIPTVSDRVLQRAALQLLQDLYEPLFRDCSFAYRPGRSLKMAVQRIIELREHGWLWVLDADIDDFFDTLDHAILFQLLREKINDAELLRLIAAWVGKLPAHRPAGKGIAMGSPLSPLLANIYLHPFDCAVTSRGHPMVRYADDFIVLAASRAVLEDATAEVQAALEILKLTFHSEKTRLTSFEEGFEFIGVRFEGDEYSYTYLDKRIESDDARVDLLFSDYGPQYG